MCAHQTHQLRSFETSACIGHTPAMLVCPRFDRGAKTDQANLRWPVTICDSSNIHLMYRPLLLTGLISRGPQTRPVMVIGFITDFFKLSFTSVSKSSSSYKRYKSLGINIAMSS